LIASPDIDATSAFAFITLSSSLIIIACVIISIAFIMPVRRRQYLAFSASLFTIENTGYFAEFSRISRLRHRFRCPLYSADRLYHRITRKYKINLIDRAAEFTSYLSKSSHYYVCTPDSRHNTLYLQQYHLSPRVEELGLSF
jgi:hypothetical protein